MSTEAELLAEVADAEHRLAQALETLRHYRLSNPEDADGKPLRAAQGTNGERGKVHHV